MPKHTHLKEEPVETGEDGKPIYGYRIEKKQLDDFIKSVKQATQDQCLFATKEDGDFVRVVVIPAGDQASKEFIEGMAKLADSTEFASYRNGVAEKELDF